MTLFGQVVEGTMPYLKVDHVLDETELSDRAKLNATLDLLKRASRGDSRPWTVAGVSVVTVSAVGLIAACWKRSNSDNTSCGIDEMSYL